MMAMAVDVEWVETTGRPLELAQIVWLQALTAEVDDGGDDDASHAFALSRLARHERAALEHALSHGRALNRRSGTDDQVDRAIRLLEAAIALANPGGARLKD